MNMFSNIPSITSLSLCTVFLLFPRDFGNEDYEHNIYNETLLTYWTCTFSYTYRNKVWFISLGVIYFSLHFNKAIVFWTFPSIIIHFYMFTFFFLLNIWVCWENNTFCVLFRLARWFPEGANSLVWTGHNSLSAWGKLKDIITWYDVADDWMIGVYHALKAW